MKKLASILFLVFPISISSVLAWTTIHTDAGGNSFYSIDFGNDLNGCAVGSNGLLVVTSDGGDTWTDATTGSSTDLRDVHYATSSKICAVGADGTILISGNNGSTWLSQSLANVYFLGVWFTDALNGWAVGTGSNPVYRTDDGGFTWNPVTVPSSSTDMNDVFFVSSQVGWIISGSDVMQTVDGGLNWTVVNSNNGGWSIHFVDANEGYIADGTTVKRTSNGGTSWSQIFSSQSPTEVHVTPSGIGLIATSSNIRINPMLGFNGQYNNWGELSAISNVFAFASSSVKSYLVEGSRIRSSSLGTFHITTLDICPDENFPIDFTSSYQYNSGNTFTVELSNDNWSNSYTVGSIQSQNPTQILCDFSAGYSPAIVQLRVVSSDPVRTSYYNGINYSLEVANPSFSASETILYAPQTVAQFTNSTYSPPNNPVDHYIWDFGDGTVLTDNNSTVYHQYNSNGQFTVSLTAVNEAGCETIQVWPNYIFVSGVVTSVGDLNSEPEIIVYPNPTTSYFRIDAIGMKEYRVFDTMGKLVLSNANITENHNVDFNNATSGVYTLQIRTENGWTTQKLVKN